MPAAVPTPDRPVGFLVGSKEAGEFQGNRFFFLFRISGIFLSLPDA